MAYNCVPWETPVEYLEFSTIGQQNSSGENIVMNGHIVPDMSVLFQKV